MSGKDLPMPSAEKPTRAYPVDELNPFSDLGHDGAAAHDSERVVEELASDGKAKNKPKSAPDHLDPQDSNES